MRHDPERRVPAIRSALQGGAARLCALAGALLAVGCASAPPPADGPAPVAATSTPRADEPRPPAANEAAGPHVEAAIAHALAGRHAEALAAAREAVRVDPHGLAANVALVEGLLATGDRGEARRRALALVEWHPRAPEAHYAHGRAALSVVSTSEARQAFENALALDPHDVPALIGLLAVAAQGDEYDELADILETLRGLLGPDLEEHPHVLHNLAVAAERRGDVEGAVSLYRRALDRPDRLAATRYNLARLLDDARGFLEARPHYEAFLDEAGPEDHRRVLEVRNRLGDPP